MASAPVETVLVPVDGSDESTDAAGYAVAVAAAYDADVHAMYVLGDEVARAVEAGAVTPEDVAAESQSYVAVIEDEAAGTGVRVTSSVAYGFHPSRLLVHPGSVILDAAEQIDADFLVIPRERAPGDEDVLEKAAEYVLLYASQPVLSV